MIELLTAGLFYLAYRNVGPSLRLVTVLTFMAVAVAAAAIDLDREILPDGLTYPAIALGLFCAAIGWGVPLASAVGGAAVAGGFLLLIALMTGGMGGGDVKFAAAMGAFLGLPNVIVGLLASFVTGALVSLALLALGIKKRKDAIPFGPFLALGAVVGLLYGKVLIEMYLGLLGL